MSRIWLEQQRASRSGISANVPAAQRLGQYLRTNRRKGQQKGQQKASYAGPSLRDYSAFWRAHRTKL